jgi:hypothetical protein
VNGAWRTKRCAAALAAWDQPHTATIALLLLKLHAISVPPACQKHTCQQHTEAYGTRQQHILCCTAGASHLLLLACSCCTTVQANACSQHSCRLQTYGTEQQHRLLCTCNGRCRTGSVGGCSAGSSTCRHATHLVLLPTSTLALLNDDNTALLLLLLLLAGAVPGRWCWSCMASLHR